MKTELKPLSEIRKAVPGACFHGEVWCRCPYCGKGHELMGKRPIRSQDGYRIYLCDCGEQFKDK